MKRTVAYMVICLFIFVRIYGQDKVIRSLRTNLFAQKDSIGYTDVLNQLGMQYHLSNTDSCFWYGVEAREVATRIGYRKGIAGALNNLSIFYMLKGNIRQAIEYGYRSLLLYREIGDDENICQLLMNLSIYHAYDNKIPEANNFLYQALDIGKKLSRDSIYSLVLINYAIRFEYDSIKQDSVRWALERSKAIITRYPGSREKYYIQAFEADEWMRNGEGAKAVKRINELADSALREGLIVVAIDLLEHIDAYNRLGYPADAVPAREKAFELGLRAGYTDLMLPIVISLYRHYVKTGNEQARLYYGNALRELVERRLALKQRNHLNHLEYFLTEQELEELQLRNK
ncbi:MAG TPA: tetratricopeptide repeat protein, partial [Chitinophaga sp.]|nr:tetratricopeptide repeat protein [Chitinophaga sp.]